MVQMYKDVYDKVCQIRSLLYFSKNQVLGAIGGIVFSFFVSVSLHADDIEVYINSSTDFGPNILFLFDLSGSMAWREQDENPPESGEESRYEILKSALDKVLTDDLGALNIGFSWFTGDGYNNYATGIKWPVTDNSAQASLFDSGIAGGQTVSDVIQSILDAQSPQGGTAIVESLYRSKLVFQRWIGCTRCFRTTKLGFRIWQLHWWQGGSCKSCSLYTCRCIHDWRRYGQL